MPNPIETGISANADPSKWPTWCCAVRRHPLTRVRQRCMVVGPHATHEWEARAIAEDEGLREVGADAVRLIFYPPNTEVSGTDRRYSAAVIAALTANREDQTNE